MIRIDRFELFGVDLPFRLSFKHAAAEHLGSYSLFLKCVLEDGTVGFGECLPREYVTGESHEGAFVLLEQRILPRLMGLAFKSLGDVIEFLTRCDGKAPEQWVPPETPQTAAWSAVDLALLDSFGKAFGVVAFASGESWPEHLHYSGALSSHRGWKQFASALKQRLYGLRAIKLKVDETSTEDELRFARRVLGKRCELRVDANMAWGADQAIEIMTVMNRYGVRSFEQPLPADDLEGLARVVERTGLDVMADESLNDAESLRRLIEARACTAVNVRISKCGGLVASQARCKDALSAGLKVQVGCHVGESSLLSAAHLALVSRVQDVTYAEGCFGERLLLQDPVSPRLQFTRGGRPPARPQGPGLGVTVHEEKLSRHCVRQSVVEHAEKK